MRRREFLRASALGAASLAGGVQGCESISQRPPNVLVILSDDQAYRQFNFLPQGKDEDGKPKNLTPTIDRLKAEGVYFSRFYCNSTVCTPSRYNLLTGRYASRSETVDRFASNGMTAVAWNTLIKENTSNVASHLRALNLTTGAVGKNHVIYTPEFVDIMASQRYSDRAIRERMGRNYAHVKARYHETGFDYAEALYAKNITSMVPPSLRFHNVDWIIQHALDFIEGNGDAPWFLYTALTVPHSPHRNRAWKGDPLATPMGFLKEGPSVMPERATIPERVKEAGLSLTTCDMTWMDDGIGALLEGLKRSGQDKTTIVLFMSDHGVDGKAKGHLYEGGTRTPLLVWGPGYFEGDREISSLTQMIDVFPTIAEFMTGDPPAEGSVDGKSIKPLLDGSTDRIHDALYLESGCSRAVVTDEYKYLAVRYPEEITDMSAAERKKRIQARHHRRVHVAGKKGLPMPDINDPFGHMGLVPGGQGNAGEAMKLYPAYHEPDQLYYVKDSTRDRKNLAGDREHGTILDTMTAILEPMLSRLPGDFGEFKGLP